MAASPTGKGNIMEPTNRDRAEWAVSALRHFQCTTGTDYQDNDGFWNHFLSKAGSKCSVESRLGYL